MTTTETFPLVLAGIAGGALGAIFFGGLWWTVRQGVWSRQPALWFLGSMLLRTTVTLAGLYFVGREHWERWLLCLLGFVLARLVVSWLIRPPGQHAKPTAPENSYAP